MNGKSKKKILILGSRGQIGSSLETYLKQKYIVKGIDILNGKNDDLRLQSNKIALSIKNVDFIFFWHLTLVALDIWINIKIHIHLS